jgi:ABC-2 type transport system ATP-binding protein
MVTIQNLHFAYKKKMVFNGLNLSLQPGFIYGLLGKNGTGKSTLLRNIAGLLFPRQGSIKVFNAIPGERNPSFLQQVFMVPEEFFLPDISIEKFVKCNAPFYPGFSHRQLDGYLKEFAIPMDHSLQQMSYGQKKKVLIAFGLACNTSLLLMDEPTNGLDILSKSQFRKIIAGATDENKCIIICTHQVKDLENLIDRVCIIDEGKILFDQPMEHITSKLQFKISFDSDETKKALYSEAALQGDAIIAPNIDGGEGRMDLEMLYKAIVLNGEGIRSVFDKQ